MDSASQTLDALREGKLGIHEISISKLAQQWLALIKPSDLTSVFKLLEIIVAIIWLKAEALLPFPAEEKPEEVEFKPPSQEWGELVGWLAEREELANQMYGGISITTQEKPLVKQSLDLSSIFKIIIERYEKTSKLEFEEESVKLDEKINYINEIICRKPKVNFKALLQSGSLLDLIVTLIAILELARQRRIKLFQYKGFGDLWVVTTQRRDSSSKSA